MQPVPCRKARPHTGSRHAVKPTWRPSAPWISGAVVFRPQVPSSRPRQPQQTSQIPLSGSKTSAFLHYRKPPAEPCPARPALRPFTPFLKSLAGKGWVRGWGRTPVRVRYGSPIPYLTPL